MDFWEYLYSTMTKEERDWVNSEVGKRRLAEFIKKKGMCGFACGKMDGLVKKTAKTSKRARNSVRRQKSGSVKTR